MPDAPPEFAEDPLDTPVQYVRGCGPPPGRAAGQAGPPHGPRPAVFAAAGRAGPVRRGRPGGVDRRRGPHRPRRRARNRRPPHPRRADFSESPRRDFRRRVRPGQFLQPALDAQKTAARSGRAADRQAEAVRRGVGVLLAPGAVFGRRGGRRAGRDRAGVRPHRGRQPAGPEHAGDPARWEGFGQYICDPAAEGLPGQVRFAPPAGGGEGAARGGDAGRVQRGPETGCCSTICSSSSSAWPCGAGCGGAAGRPPPLPVSAKIDARIRKLFPFDFTGGQNDAVKQIAADLASETAMHPVIAGGRGSRGKTVVALYAMLVAVAHGKQAVLMAPTEVLANQHWATVQHALRHSRVERQLLTGPADAEKAEEPARPHQERGRATRHRHAGAHSEGGGDPAAGGGGVVDEQHKFGVAQRAAFSARRRGAARLSHDGHPRSPAAWPSRSSAI